MADYSGVISLSHLPTYDDDSSEHTLRTFPTLSPYGGGGGSSKSKSNNIMNSTDDDQYHHHHLITPPLKTTPKKPRGRPPGSKNKPKPPLVITRDIEPAMNPVIIEISAGSDIIDTIVSFARRNHVCVTIISATGYVSNVTLRNTVYHAPLLCLRGPFELLSLSGSFIALNNSSSNGGPQSSLSCSFGVTLAGVQGKVFGGIVGGKLMVATEAIVVVATFVSPAFHRLPCEADNEDHRQETNPSIHGKVGGGGSGVAVGGAMESSYSNGMSMPVNGLAVPLPLNRQISPDVMLWGPLSHPY